MTHDAWEAHERRFPADEEGWRPLPKPPDSAAPDPELDLVEGPTAEWAARLIERYLAKETSFDQFFRALHDLRYEYYLKKYAERLPEHDMLAQFSEFATICAYVSVGIGGHNEEELLEYLPAWPAILRRGQTAWKRDVDRGIDPFTGKAVGTT